MKFLLEFVSCCGSSSRRMVEDETRSLVTEARRPRRQKRGRLVAVTAGVGVSSGSHVVEWKPTLSSISENNALPERNKNVNVGAESVKRKKPSSSTPKARTHRYRNDVGRAPPIAMLPALPPAPFLF